SFVRGLVDSQDVTLNISREMLQHDRQLKLIRTSLERKIKNELTSWLANDREKYEEFFGNFGLQLKVGAYSQFGAEADNLKDLLLFRSAKLEKLVTLSEYLEAMPEGQTYIYYAAGGKDSAARLAALPQAGLVMDKGYDLLLLTEEVDEFVLQVMRKYGEGDDAKEFRNISGGDLGLESEDEKKEIEAQNEAHKPLFEAMQKALEGKVKEVRVSGRLGDNPVIITAEGGLSLEMEKVLNSMPSGEKVESTKVLELNADHPIFAKLKALSDAGDTEKLDVYTGLLYDQALMIEGLPVADPAAYSRAVSALLAE
ncbi:molecular chaperone HtpG, partial [Ruminococcaceae bacterium OttesenSCG-928-D13]|nr:molecular chaperone HtpG [Ruminococcaceae bacterium OttesenSCG-928-D13]